MKPRKHSFAGKIIGIVAIIATMLGGAFMGYRSAGSSWGDSSGNEEGTPALVGTNEANVVNASTAKTLRAAAEMSELKKQSTAADPELADILRRGDKAALDRLMPQGIREIEGMGGKGLARQVKSHGMWFPVFDLSQSKKSAAPGSKPKEDGSDVDPDEVKVNKIPLSIIAPPPFSGLVGETFDLNFSAVGGVPPYLWSMKIIEGSAAFYIDMDRGTVIGNATEPTKAKFVVSVRDAANANDSVVTAVTISPPKPLTITTTALPDAIVGQPFTAALKATGGVPPLTWVITSAPAEWTCAASGTVTATPNEAREFDLEATVTDSQGTTDQKTLHVQVTEGIKITTESPLMPAAPSENYVQRFDASGGTSPYHWSISRGALPPGWALSDDGTLTGVAGTEEQLFHFTVEARDTNDLSQKKDFELALRRVLIAVGSREKVGLAWLPQEVSRAAQAPLAGVSVERDGAEIYRGTGTNIVDYGRITGMTYRYTLNAHTADGRKLPISSALVRLLPMTLKRAVPGMSADPFADRVKLFQPLSRGGYGSAFMNTNVTGPPDGRSTFLGASAETEVLSLHASKSGGGSILLEFTDNIITDEPGPDLTVFENVFFVGGDPNNRFMEPAVVEVALFDGQWMRFPTRVSPPVTGEPNLRRPSYYAAGFTGVNATTGDDPTDPSRSGGDSFDLSALNVPDLHWIRFIRIHSTGDSVMTDSTGTVIRHTGENNALSGTGSSGFDLDAVSAAHY